MNKKIIIVGGGISGIYCSILLKQKLNNTDVIVLESNTQPLKKLLSTGNGRCNLSNTDMKIDYYHSDDHHLVEKIISNFDIHELEDLGLLLTHINHLIYPRSEQALTVKRVLLDYANNLGVNIITSIHVISVDYINNAYIIHTDSKDYHSDYCILSLGSNASSLSGSDKDRYDLLKKLNLKVIEPQSSLCALNTKEKYPTFKGVRVKGKVTLLKDQNIIHTEKGELLFTDYGISGICVMQLSHYINHDNHYQVILDLFDDMNEDTLHNLLIQNSHHTHHYLDGLLNTKLAEYFEKKYTIEELPYLLKHLTFNISSKRDIEYAQVISGGLSLKEVSDTLELKQYKHMYCLGELLNVNGMCGGYNIHFALSCAKTCATDIIEALC